MTFNSNPRALWYVRPGQCELRSEELGPPGPGDALVETSYSAVSRGTERLVCTGAVPTAVTTEMRAPFQAGDFPFPVKYGYACVGKVQSGPAPLIGTLVFCLHPHQSQFIVPAASLHPLPEEIDPGRAVLAANLETAVNAIWDSQASVGDRVAVFGLGTVGLLCGYLLSSIPGVNVVAIDPNASARRLGDVLGMRTIADGGDEKPFDIVLETSGNPDALQRAIEVCGDESKLVVVSWYGDHPVALHLGGRFHQRRIRLVASQVSHLPADRRGRWTHARRLDTVFGLLRDEALDTIITRDVRFSELAESLPPWLESGASAGTLRVVY